MRPVLRRLFWCSAVALATLAAEASAEVVVFESGRTMTVRGHRVDGSRIILVLAGGGELSCPASVLTRIDPDELPDLSLPAGAGNAVRLPPVPFGDIIDGAAARHGVDPRLVRAVISVESAFQPEARSSKGAMGLMQLMRATSRQYGVSDPFDPAANVDAGVRHLRSLLDRYDLDLALAAYNAGEQAVTRHGGIPPYPETIGYVRQVRRLLGAAAPGGSGR